MAARGRPFQKGQVSNPKGRPKGSRHKLSESFIKVLAEDFAKNGKRAVATVSRDDPAAYLKLVAGLVPKEVKAEVEARVVFTMNFGGGGDGD